MPLAITTLFFTQNSCNGITLQKTGLFNEVVKFATISDEFRWCVEFGHSTVVQNDDTVRVDNGVDAVCNRDYRSVFEDTAAQSLLKKGIGLYIDSGLEFLLAKILIFQRSIGRLPLLHQALRCCLGLAKPAPKKRAVAGLD